MKQLILSFKSVMLIFVGIVLCLGISLIVCSLLVKPDNSSGGNAGPVSIVLEIENNLSLPYSS